MALRAALRPPAQPQGTKYEYQPAARKRAQPQGHAPVQQGYNSQHNPQRRGRGVAVFFHQPHRVAQGHISHKTAGQRHQHSQYKTADNTERLLDHIQSFRHMAKYA